MRGRSMFCRVKDFRLVERAFGLGPDALAEAVQFATEKLDLQAT
jgi:hypothetical protein